MVTELRLVLVLFCVMLIPGWAILAVSGIWRTWQGLERWIIAVGLSIAFYPLLFYGLRLLLPFLTLGPYKMGALLFVGLGIAGWRLRHDWRDHLRFSWQEWATLLVIALTLGTRWWVAVRQPYPAWTDSLHHVLLTKLTAVQGQLPTTLDPYFPIPLDLYHLGLHGIAAVVMWLAQTPAHTALLWTAQTMNGLCGLGVYLVLRRSGARTGALVGAAVVGLWAHQPAFYVNWGRFTQLSSQTILLIAYSVVMTALVNWAGVQRARRRVLWLSLFAAMFSAAVFLLHFRVAAFYLVLLAPGILALAWRRRSPTSRLVRMVGGTGLIGVSALLLVLPVLLPALDAYLASYRNLATQTVVEQEEIAQVVANYFDYTWQTVPLLAAHVWLLIAGGIAGLIGVIRRQVVAYVALGWTVLLLLLAHTYLLGVSAFNVTNPGAVFIMLYLPLGLMIGAGAESVLRWVAAWRSDDAPIAAVPVTTPAPVLAPAAVRDGLPSVAPSTRRRVWGEVVVALVAVGIGLYGATQRVQEIEPFRFFVTDADVRAMHWIDANLPPDARFAVNTHFWLASTPHGTDAGYWLPYFTNREMTAAVMVASLGSERYQKEVLATSALVKQLEPSPADAEVVSRDAVPLDTVIDELLARGVAYVYIGQRGSFEGPGLQAEMLVESGRAELLYAEDHVAVLALRPGE